MKIHRADDRGIAEHGWLHSRYSFSFAEYHHPDRMGFGALRVINDDVVEPGTGFEMHPHRDMEVVTIVTRGAVAHKDSEGHEGISRAGQIQYMSTGSGIYHSESNPSKSERLELFQIWIKPNEKGVPPCFVQRDFSDVDDRNRWVLLVSPQGEGGAIPIRQDATILTTRLEAGQRIVSDAPKQGHGRLLFVVEGEVHVGEELLSRRDEAQIEAAEAVAITAESDAWLLLFDVPMEI
jgi:redox-sensitive bicupin YhaK (pirin superfamily)